MDKNNEVKKPGNVSQSAADPQKTRRPAQNTRPAKSPAGSRKSPTGGIKSPAGSIKSPAGGIKRPPRRRLRIDPATTSYPFAAIFIL